MKLFHYIQRLRRLPFSILPRFIVFQIKKKAYKITEPFLYSYSSFSPSVFSSKIHKLKNLNLLHPDVRSVGFGEMFKEEFPLDYDEILKQADQITDLKIDLLGSGWVDLKKINNGKIPWNYDFKSGYCWPANTFFGDIKIKFIPGVDIKVPWELSRCHQFVTLGQAYALTNNEKYAVAFFSQWGDWVNQNPVKYGVNWACPMDVAIRACNWLLAWGFFSHSSSKPVSFDERMVESLYQHGLHVWRHLEWGADVSSNHYLSNLVGLAYIGVALGNQEWVEFSKKELEKEVFHQTFSDGFDYETSTGYHRLVLEIFFYAALLFERQDAANARLSLSFYTRLSEMFKTLNSLMTSSGKVPLIGDNDSGHLFILKSRPDERMSYLSDLGALFFKENRLKINGTEKSSDMIWFFGFPGFQTWKAWTGLIKEDNPGKKAGSSGLAVLQGAGTVVFSAQQNGIHGVGGHTHNDKLSFTFSLDDEWFFVDPGNYVYTADPEKRNLFRSTRMHNTVEVDGQEQNRFHSDSLFTLHDDSQVIIEDDILGKEIVATHTGYRRLKDPVEHKRKMKSIGKEWVIEDFLIGNDVHDLLWSFICAPNLKIEIGGKGQFLVRGQKYQLKITASQPLEFRLEECFISPGYGRLVMAHVLRAGVNVKLPFSSSFQIEVQSLLSN